MRRVFFLQWILIQPPLMFWLALQLARKGKRRGRPNTHTHTHSSHRATALIIQYIIFYDNHLSRSIRHLTPVTLSLPSHAVLILTHSPFRHIYVIWVRCVLRNGINMRRSVPPLLRIIIKNSFGSGRLSLVVLRWPHCVVGGSCCILCMFRLAKGNENYFPWEIIGGCLPIKSITTLRVSVKAQLMGSQILL